MLFLPAKCSPHVLCCLFLLAQCSLHVLYCFFLLNVRDMYYAISCWMFATCTILFLPAECSRHVLCCLFFSFWTFTTCTMLFLPAECSPHILCYFFLLNVRHMYYAVYFFLLNFLLNVRYMYCAEFLAECSLHVLCWISCWMFATCTVLNFLLNVRHMYYAVYFFLLNFLLNVRYMYCAEFLAECSLHVLCWISCWMFAACTVLFSLCDITAVSVASCCSLSLAFFGLGPSGHIVLLVRAGWGTARTIIITRGMQGFCGTQSVVCSAACTLVRFACLLVRNLTPLCMSAAHLPPAWPPLSQHWLGPWSCTC